MERNLTHIALFAAMIAALGLIPRFEIVPGIGITAQSMGVMLCGTILGARLGGLAAGLFVLVLLLGLPIWAGGVGGVGLLATGKVGFIVGFPFAAFVTGWMMSRLPASIPVSAFFASVIGGMGVLYAFGIPGMAWGLGKTLNEALVISLSFIPGDLVKAVLTAAITAAVAKARPAALLSRG
ncbi:biotin transporter BioY [Tabrizicola oligotrophica]|uniref:Biotin transporter n=1 Tax=Tabrizicola oligotrophica TaxID=2710650 RepID=A0A6M0QYD7_9RHOB|nr:biotin transporter BioY [Tabrizicola oligotrophica]NEY91472.1 BioY family transporter [Tabrizicola oligotrophica]